MSEPILTPEREAEARHWAAKEETGRVWFLADLIAEIDRLRVQVAAAEKERDEARDKVKRLADLKDELESCLDDEEDGHFETMEAWKSWKQAVAELVAGLEMVMQRWTFNGRQEHTHTWHDWADCKAVIAPLLAKHGAPK